MFSRITISDVPASRVVHIAFSVLKPEGWEVTQEHEWLTVAPRWRRDAGFTLLMPHRSSSGPERLLGEPDGLARYLAQLFPELEEIGSSDEEDELCPYELRCFHGRIDGIAGRVAVIGTSVAVEDINFALLGFARDEHFHRLRPIFRTMVASFQPVITGDR